jgi:hypothetical protein
MLFQKIYIGKLENFATMVLTYENIKKKDVGQEHKRVKAHYGGLILFTFMTCKIYFCKMYCI